ncbi:MAG TPA: AarF/ABC1/UbiB kinase family protein [Caulobacteraceae bacterium]|jgi:predicted unusual protein kinase regulating ubiquinone biosynthesis (AarF/ABC1/UbiB family)|nr:AarF/ABC1/UbiB kinase family protein [Caulobacteraceae bacterium]
MERDPERDRLAGRVIRLAKVGAGLSGAAASFGANALFAGGDAEARNARALKEALGRLKGPMMKVAQMVATIPDLLPPQFAAELAELQTNAPAMGPAFVRRRMAAELGPDWRERFGEFDLVPAAAASLGQVHRARDLTGADLAVKLQYPEMQSAIESDLGQLKAILALARQVSSAIDTREVVTEIGARLREELDYVHEARAMSLYGAFFARHDEIAVPAPRPALSTGRLLAMDWLDGAGLFAFKAADLDTRNRVARLLFEAWWTPFTRIGVIHGDPHLGNYSFTAGAGRLNLLDFGCIRVFPPAFVGGVVQLFHAIGAGDRAAEREAYRIWGFENLSDELMEAMGVWARFIYGPLLDDRVRTVADGVSPGAYGRREAFQVKRALMDKGPVTIPREFVFMDRAAIGLGAAFLHLGAELNWRRIFEAALEGFSESALAERQAAALAEAGLA